MSDRLRDINLLPQYERQSSSHYVLFIVFLVVVLLAYAFIGYQYFTTKSKVESAEAEYALLNEQLDELEGQGSQLETESSKLAHAVLFAENHDIPTSQFIVEITDSLPENSYFSEYEYSNQIANIIAHFETLDAIANYTTGLLTSDYVNDTKVDEVITFDYNEEGDTNKFLIDNETIPRYETDFTLQINKQRLKGESREDE